MSDVEPCEDDSVENPDPEVDADDEIGVNLNVEADNARVEHQNVEANHSCPEGQNHPNANLAHADDVAENINDNAGQRLNAEAVDGNEENVGNEIGANFDSNSCGSEQPEGFQQDIDDHTEADSHCHGYNVNGEGSRRLLEPENINSNHCEPVDEHNDDTGVLGFNALAAEDEQYIHNAGSCSGANAESDHVEDSIDNELDQETNNAESAEGTEHDVGENQANPDGLELREDEYLGPESELEEVQDDTNIENEPTESDQDINRGASGNPVTNGESVNNEATEPVPIAAVASVADQPVHDLTNEAEVNVTSGNDRFIPEDELSVVSPVKSETGAESYQPECDQSGREGTSVSSQNTRRSVERSGGVGGAEGNLAENCDLNGVKNDRPEIDGKNVNSKDNTANGLSSAYCDKNTKSADDTIKKHESTNPECSNIGEECVKMECSSVVNTNSGAIPKVHKQNNALTAQKSKDRCTKSDKVSDSSRVELIDSEDELLNELDETLKGSCKVEASSSDISSRETCAMAKFEQNTPDSILSSCDQCLRNNLQCTFEGKGNHGDQTDNTSGLKHMKKQLHQAKQLLLDRECEISRLKEDLSDHRLRCETLTSERDSHDRELKRLKDHNSDDLYIPQIKELEYTIAQQSNEIRSLKDKLSSHDGAAKRAIATLQGEMKLRVEQVMKQCEEARSEKDTMVVKYAQAEHKNLEFQKRAERAENKLKDMEKERDVFLGKMKAVKDQRSKLAADLEGKNQEACNLYRDLDKHREMLSSADNRVKWAQNKLKAELEAHKDTKIQLDKMVAKLKEAKEETQQIRQDCQAIIKTYQESEEVKSNSLDKELKQKESELLEREVQQTNFELAHVKTQRELEQVKTEFKESQLKLSALREKLASIEVEKDQATVTNAKYGDIIQNQKREIQDLQQRVDSLVQYKTDFTSAQELIKNLDTEIAELKMTNKELVSDMDSCNRRESDKLQLTSKLSRKNADLQSENSTLSNKVLTLTGELQAVKMEIQESETKLKDLEDGLANEQKLRHDEVQSLNTKLAGKCKAVEDLSRKLDDEKDEIKTLKRKHTNNIKDLTRQLQQVRRKLETYEVSTNGDKDTVSMGSRTSSNGSLNTVNIADQTVTHVVQPNNVVSNSVQRNPSPEQEYPVITEQIEVDKQTLIERIVKLQRTLARKNEKIEFMEEHVSQLVDEIQKKNKIIQSYILKEEAGTMTSEHRDNAKAEISRKHSIMGSVYSSHSNDGTMTLDLSLEINRKVQAVLEDTLLKNMMLKENLDTLGKEIARLSQENRRLQLQLQGGKSRPRTAQSSR